MLCELYIEALLVDEELADQVWELWNAGLISDNLAALAWWLIAVPNVTPIPRDLQSRATCGIG